MNRSQLKIDIVSDVVCPWCAIGYKKLSEAMTQMNEEVNFIVNWKPYELHPEIPAEGFDKKEYYRIKELYSKALLFGSSFMAVAGVILF